MSDATNQDQTDIEAETETFNITSAATAKNGTSKFKILTISILVMVVILSAIFLQIVISSNLSFKDVSEKILPVTMVADKINATSLQLNAEVPDVLNAKDQAELSVKYAALVKFIAKQSEFVKELNAISHNSTLSNELLTLIEQASTKLAIVNDYMSNILWTKELVLKTTVTLRDVSNRFILQITKLSDDALFEVITNSTNKTNEKTENTTSNKNNKELTILNMLLEIKADGILATGILETVINHMNIEEIVPFQEKFEAAAVKLKEHLGVLAEMDPNKFINLQTIIMDLLNLGQAKDNCFALRETELRFANKIGVVAKELKPIGSRLEVVEKLLLIEVLKNIEAVNGFKNQYNKLIIGLSGIFLVLLVLLGVFVYYVRKLLAAA